MATIIFESPHLSCPDMVSLLDVEDFIGYSAQQLSAGFLSMRTGRVKWKRELDLDDPLLKIEFPQNPSVDEGSSADEGEDYVPNEAGDANATQKQPNELARPSKSKTKSKSKLDANTARQQVENEKATLLTAFITRQKEINGMEYAASYQKLTTPAITGGETQTSTG